MPKTMLITGCSTGIGASLVHSFQKRGLAVFATARTLSTLSAFEELSNVHTFALDVTLESSVQECYDKVRVTSGVKLDYLVNNAGIGWDQPVLDYPIEEGEKIFETNFWGVLRMIQVFAPLMLESKGTIVNVTSVLAYVNMPFKTAVAMLSETLRLEVAPFGVKVLAIVTGTVGTEFAVKTGDLASLPDSSLYEAIEADFKKFTFADDGRKKTSSDEFAEDVVKDILGGATVRVWRGASALLGRIGAALFPQ
ncbi:NADPH-dependent 1-acyldihydroxyacetone phosphate reductase [Massarina eburnea CBS 473.64]|uniref:NADPH-dependent 1-acyldihydroxyacetone phosphate reductase n=1 Tax=Massarina eburnea CBS 473.64 TaxID=1395130 RepID=A0A6A6RPL8_9PLEO|nr:NADPH-dependent 1-acyldihydroxyacetone phosphate reductase [Massarina eburnea CBS 473.64]